MRAWWLAALAFAVYVLPGRNGGSADTFPAQFLPLSMLGEGNLDFNEFVCPADAVTGRAIAYDPAQCLAPLPYYLQAHEGRVVSAYPIVAGLLNVPVHLAARALGVDGVQRRYTLGLITAAAITASSVAVLVLVLGRLGFRETTATAVGAVYAFGTLAWSSSGIGLWQHGPSLLWILLATLAVLRGDRRAVAAAGVLLGLAVWTRPTNALIALPLGLYVLRRHPTLRLPFAIASAVPLAAMALYSQWAFGSVLALGQGQQMRIGSQPLLALAGVLFSPGRGLFVYSPVLLVGLLAMPRALRAADPHPVIRPLILGAVGVVLVHAAWAVWWGGHSFGYRLVTETLPAMMILVALAWERNLSSRLVVRLVAGVLLAWSVWANAMGALVAPCGFDTEPDYLDTNPSRTWSLRETELERCTRRVFDGMARR